MIGVLCAENEKDVAREFFELFKTPWELFDPSQRYDVVLSTTGMIPEGDFHLVIGYSSRTIPYDDVTNSRLEPGDSQAAIIADDFRLPIYGKLSYIVGQGLPIIQNQGNPGVFAAINSTPDYKIIRVGYDLFQEILTLLTEGQPVAQASIPTVELHISLIRNWILDQGISLIEIPPYPLGYQLFACLTHDIDFAGIRRHFFDHTMWGFIYRSLVGTLFSFLKKKKSIAALVKNWVAVARLPFVYLGISDDFWEHFDRYSEIDIGNGSTYFLIPFKNRPGDRVEGNHRSRRAVRYDVGDIKKQIAHLTEMDAEIALHGIDSWHSAEKGKQELARIVDTAGQKETGNRVHWLIYNHQSPSILEQAGFDYDATLGYNETIGFRNGTTQVFQPIGLSHLLEIPLNIQDTALFFPGRMALSDVEAKQLCSNLLDTVVKYHGVLTLSWHDRSLVSERLWADFYVNLLQDLEAQHAWIGNARQVVSWFRQRRSVLFEEANLSGDKFCLKVRCDKSINTPPLFFRLYVPKTKRQSGKREYQIYDIPWKGDAYTEILLNEDFGSW